RKRAYCLKIQPATGSFARNLIYSTKPYYTTRKKISDITREIQLVAPWLTDSEARKRVRWCLEIFRAKAFLSVHKAIHAD
ncbi:hypothetical protein ELJ07_22520, partial [Klebsiella pneumoniae]|nr:hypothetical protein [Klebsiella pneumoniae]